MRRRAAGVVSGRELRGDEPPFSAERAQDLIAALEPAVTETRRARIQEVLARRMAAVTVVVDALHDPHNGAALVRSCDAFGVQTLHAVERDEPLAVAGTVARGSQKWIDIVRHDRAEACVEALRASGHELVAAHPDGELTPEDIASIPRAAIVLGNERDGIAPELRAACTRAVRVPMVGFVQSLNVSVTAAILLFAATRGRRGDLSESRRRALYARALWLSVPRADERVEAWRARNVG